MSYTYFKTLKFKIATGDIKMSQMKTLAVRLPESAIREMEQIAKARYVPTRTMIRSWIMVHLDAERAPATNGEDSGEAVT
jgi:hypothetical protein